ncbi:MAG: helix-turn-helix domain-containing protein, partial [Bacteroidota bacterium]
EAPQHEILVAMFKVFLIRCLDIYDNKKRTSTKFRQNLPESILAFDRQVELHFKKLHYPIDYGDKINVTLTTLGKLTREFLNKTLTQVIQERIVKEAKKELLGSHKPIKEIARELGFKDEYYFNRLFEQSTNISPIHFRKYNKSIVTLKEIGNFSD